MKRLLVLSLWLATSAAAADRPAPKSLPPAVPIPGHVQATLGKREVILESGRSGLKYFPDECLAFVRTTSPIRLLTAAGISSVLLEGRDMRSLTSRGEVLRPGRPGSFDNGYAGIGGLARDPATGQLLAFYHAEDHEGMRLIPGGIPGFYCSIALAVSTDEGASFRKLGPVVTSSLPKDVTGRADQGSGEMCVLADADRQYLSMYYSDHTRVGHGGVQICMARCRIQDAATPGHWRKYDGRTFAEPGLGGKDTPVVSAEALRADALFPHVAYVPELHQYLMVFNIAPFGELSPSVKPRLGGIYLACSPDGMHWSKPTQLVVIHSLAAVGAEVGWHPTLVVSRMQGDVAEGWLYYSYSENWGHQAPRKPHYLVGQPISISLAKE